MIYFTDVSYQYIEKSSYNHRFENSFIPRQFVFLFLNITLEVVNILLLNLAYTFTMLLFTSVSKEKKTIFCTVSKWQLLKKNL